MRKSYLKKIKDFLFVFVFVLGLTASFCFVEGVEIPEAGLDSGSATQLEAGYYIESEGISEDVKYYYLDSFTPGQQIKIYGDAEVSGNQDRIFDAKLLDKDRDIVASCSEIMAGDGRVNDYSFSFLTKKGGSDKYFLKFSTRYGGLDSYSVNVEFNNYYDATSTTDAGNLFEDAISLNEGNFKGYLSDDSDKLDFYKLSLNKGEGLYIKLTPPIKGSSQFKILDENRRNVLENWEGEGIIVEKGFIASDSGDFYLGIMCENCYEDGIMEYDLELEKKEGQKLINELGSSSVRGSEVVAEGDVEEKIEDVSGVNLEEEADNLSKEAGGFFATIEKIKNNIVSWLIKIVIGFGILIAVVVFLVIYLKNKKKKEKENQKKENQKKEKKEKQ